MKAVFLLTLIAIVLFLVWFFDSCRQSPKPEVGEIWSMRQDLRYAEGGDTVTVGNFDVKITEIQNGCVSYSAVGPSSGFTVYLPISEFMEYAHKVDPPKPVLHMMEDTTAIMPDSLQPDFHLTNDSVTDQYRIIANELMKRFKLKPIPFPGPGYLFDSLRKAKLPNITVDAQGRITTSSNYWTIPDLW